METVKGSKLNAECQIVFHIVGRSTKADVNDVAVIAVQHYSICK